MDQNVELERIDNAIRYIHSAGFTYADEILKDYYICLKTKPFVILAGMSGTGKTQITRLFAKALAAHYTLISVASSWRSDSDLLGFYDKAAGVFRETRFVALIRAALQTYKKGMPDLFFVCLDEMNLARVEHYFAKFLSAMEGLHVEDRKIVLDGTGETLYWPPNLLFIGTVNMDETTFAFSDKVLDRANSLEFTMTVDDIYAESVKRIPPEPQQFTFQEFLASRKDLHDPSVREVSKRWRGEIAALWKMLEPMNFHFGYRIRDEMELYLANAAGLLDERVAFDLSVKQKILPKISGRGDSLKMLLMNLQDYFTEKKYRYSAKKIEEMKRRLIRDDFTGYYPGQQPPRRADGFRASPED
ncbi:MAG: AAA family ATPase [Candidatus Riflebacteria bacterium]|nr:AAA family ATPase [Candidatus Riflebacteria bacterium]